MVVAVMKVRNPMSLMGAAACTLMLAAALVFSPSYSFAVPPPGSDAELSEDEIWIAPSRRASKTSSWYPAAIESLRGRVTGLDAKQLTLAVANQEGNTTIAADRVVWIQPSAMSDSQSAMTQAFDEGRFRQSLAFLPEVLKSRPPIWRQQWLTMLAASAAKRSGRPKIALELVSQLDRRPLPPMVIAWLPIDWIPAGRAVKSTSNVRQQVASDRIGDDSALVRLVAASWLLGTAKRSVAIVQLKSLTRLDQRPTVAKLAQVLLWTTMSPPDVIQSESKWQSQLESLPMVLQVGPTLALQHKFQTSGLTESANRLRWSSELTPIDARLTNLLVHD